MKTKIDVKKYIFLALAFLLAFGSIVGAYMASANGQRVEQAQVTKINQLKNDLGVKEAAAQKTREEVNQDATGIDAQRKKKDDEIIKQIMGAALTWNSYQSYMDGRTKLMTGFGIKEDSPLLKTMMPKVENRTDPSGKSYNVIDTQSLNSRFEGIDTRVSMVKVTDYSYFGIVKAKTKSKVGNTEVDVFYAVSYTFDANGKLLDLKIDTVPEAPATAR